MTAPGMQSGVVVDGDFYRQHYQGLLGGQAPALHYETEGRARGLMPNASFDPLVAAIRFPGVPEAEAAALIEEQGLEPLLKALAKEVFERVDHADAFDWRFADTQVHTDHPERQQALLAHWEEIDADGAVEFDAGGKHYCIRKRSPDYWKDLITSGKPSVRARLPHGLMDALGRIAIVERVVQELWGETLATAERIGRLATRLVRVLYAQSPVFTENFIAEVAELCRTGDDPVSPCLAFKAHPDYPDRLFGSADPSQVRWDAATDFIARNFADGTVFEDGIAWKRFASTGSIGTLIEAMRERKVVLVSNKGFAALGERWELPDFHHLEVPPANSHLTRYDILDGIESELNEAGVGQRDHPPAIVLTQAGGSFSFWLLCNLSRRLPYAVYFDLGQAINLWFLDDAPTGKPEMLWLQDFWERILDANDLFDFYDRLLDVPDSRSHFREAVFTGEILAKMPKHSGDFNFAWRMVHLGLSERALMFAERAHAKTPDAVPPLVLLTRLYRHFRRTDEALEACQKGLAMDPSHAVLKQFHAELTGHD
ncbi:hypothetical protein [Rhodobium gokarnense]|uniref:Tetratricopeptide repeat protein n=1 Tax=Rhodobium gokarnense TaxID=364296 RepID=A0ABT3HE21_9HYPH|nr:hypothetical protein [Rhodobium gokarnense]MCW2308638.1 hypothetical protein [Rhodobium gokarnense]